MNSRNLIILTLLGILLFAGMVSALQTSNIGGQSNPSAGTVTSNENPTLISSGTATASSEHPVVLPGKLKATIVSSAEIPATTEPSAGIEPVAVSISPSKATATVSYYIPSPVSSVPPTLKATAVQMNEIEEPIAVMISTQNQNQSIDSELRIRTTTETQNGFGTEIEIEDKGVKARTREELEIKEQKMFIKKSGQTVQVKVLPSVASQRAIEAIQLNPNKEIFVELKTVPVGLSGEEKPVYEVKGTQSGKLLGLIPFEFPVSIQIDAADESTAVQNSSKPWWSFLVFP